MLSDDFDTVSTHPGPALLALGAGLALGFLVGWLLLFNGSDAPVGTGAGEQIATPAPTEPPATPSPSAPTVTPAPALTTAALGTALGEGVSRAHEQGGTVQAALATADGGVLALGDKPDRPVPTGTLLRAATAMLGAERRELTPQDVDRTLRDADGCWDRGLIARLELQDPVASLRAFLEGRQLPGIDVAAADAAVPPDCRTELGRRGTTASPQSLTGSRWTITDAASFGRMLGSQAQDIGGGRMVDHVRKTRVDWGATRALAAFDPAVLTGWTGDPAKPTSAEQLAVLDVDGQQVVAAAYYTPDEPLAAQAMKEKADAVFAELWAPLAKQLAAPEGER